MNDRLEKIHQLLIELDDEMASGVAATGDRDFSALELLSAANIDYDNVWENRIEVYERDGFQCRYCQKQLTRFTATLDHVMPVAEGGDNGFENLVTACLNCNSRKHKRPVGDFLVEK